MLAMTWWNRPGLRDYDGILCDGAVRSGKTVSMVVGFFLWSMASFSNQNFAICGKTVGGDKIGVLAAKLFCTFIHHADKAFNAAADFKGNRKTGIVCALNHNTVKKVSQRNFFTRLKLHCNCPADVCRIQHFLGDSDLFIDIIGIFQSHRNSQNFVQRRAGIFSVGIFVQDNRTVIHA